MLKNIIFVFIGLFFLSCNSSDKILAQRDLWIQDYAFCSCLEYSMGSKIKNSIREIDFSRAMLFDIADLGIIYKQLDSLALEASDKIKSTQISDYKEKKPIIAKCLEFSRSKKIKTVIKNNK